MDLTLTQVVNMDLVYKQEFSHSIQDSIDSLAVIEWEELQDDPDDMNIDWDKYKQLMDLGVLKLFTVSHDDVVVGYLSTFVTSPFTNKNETISIYEAIYIRKEYRSYKTARGLFNFVEACMKEDGVSRVIATSRKKRPISTLLKRFGYEEIETKYEKVL